MPLQTAVDRGLIEIAANHLDIQFVNKSGRAATISFSAPTALGEAPQAPVRAEILNAITTGSQQKIWQAASDERRLKANGWIPTTPTAAQYRAGIVGFQKARGLPSTGTIDGATSRALAELESSIEKRLASVGFEESLRGADNTQTFSDAVRSYQSFLGLPDTGIFTDSISERLRADEAILKDLSRASSSNGPFVPRHRAVMASQTSDGELGAMVKTRSGLEFWMVDELGVSRQKGQSAVLSFEKMSAYRAGEATVDATVLVQPLPQFKGAEDDLAIDGEAMNTGLTSLLKGGKPDPALTEAIDLARQSSGAPAKVIVVRSKLEQAASTSPSSMESLKALGVSYPDAKDVARAIAARYGANTEVYVANDIELGVSNATSLPSFSAGSQLRIYVDGQRIKDYGLIDNIRPDLRDANIELLNIGDHGRGQPNVVLIAGHNDANLRETISGLSKQGAFKNRIVALAVCGQGGEMEFNTQLIRDAGAKAVLFYDVTINAQAVEDVMLKFAQLLMRDGVRDRNFQRIWNRAVDEAIRQATEAESQELRKLKSALFQVAGLLRLTEGTPTN